MRVFLILLLLCLSACSAPKWASVHVESSGLLNSDTQLKSYPVALEWFALKDARVFRHLEIPDFLNCEQALLGKAVLANRRTVMLPKSHKHFFWGVPQETQYIGVIALFHSPAPHRWKKLYSMPTYTVGMPQMINITLEQNRLEDEKSYLGGRDNPEPTTFTTI